MSDFVDDRAAEEPEENAEEPEEGGDELPEDEEEASEGEGGSDDDSDDSSAEGDDEDEFENDGFIVDEEDEDEGGEEGKEGSDVENAAEAKKRRKKRRRSELVLDEEDYQLVEDNTGIRRQRPQQQHRRIKRARDAEGGSAQQQQDAARALQEELFGLEDDGLEDEDEDEAPGGGATGGARAGDRVGGDARPGGRDEPPQEQADDQYFDDEDDWLVHEDEEEGGGGAAAGQRRRRRRAAFADMPDIDPDALAEADDIFGNVDDLLAMYEERRVARGGPEEELEEEEEYGEEDELDDEAAEARRLAREERQRAAAAKRLQEQLDPEAMARHFLLPRDEQIRETDVPEREQLHRGPDPADFDLEACAAWVWEHLAGPAAKGKAAEVLEDGAREVEGPPPSWYRSSRWDPRDLKGRPEDIASNRALYLGRGSSDAVDDWRESPEAQGQLRQAIRAVLEQHYEQHLEIPFIAQYRKELCGELLAVRSSDEPQGLDHDGAAGVPPGIIRASNRRIRRYEVLFAVHQLAQRWKAMQVRREARQRAYEKALGETLHSGEQAAIQACIDLLKQARSMEELDDCEAKFRLATQQSATEDALSQLSLGGGPAGRRPQKTSTYSLCIRAGLGDWVAGLGLTAAQLAENVEAGYRKHIPTDLQITPAEHSEKFVAAAGGFSTPDAVQKGGCHVAAMQIAAEPLLRQEVRRQYQEHATVTTKPTAEGEATLNAFHVLGPAKRLAGKPLSKFEGSDLFLRVLQAEKAGLITVEVGLPEKRVELLLESLSEPYISDGLSVAAHRWDELRRSVLRDAVVNLLLPVMEREARSGLAADARAAVLEAAADRLWHYASQAPLQVRLADEEETESERRVMAVCYGPGNPATTFVMLDPSGNLVDFMHCPQFSGPIPKRKAILGQVYNMFEDPKKAQDAARVRQFIETHKPHAIVVGASSPEARTLELDLQAILESILIDNPRFFTELGTGGLPILMADEAVAAAWENSAPAREELAASSPMPIVRRAVGLGRQLLDPLALLASLCGRSREVLSLQLHPLQAQVPEDERMAVVERVLVTATSQVGVDLNAVVSSTWQSASLQFAPGLGARKAAALLRGVQRAGGFVESRNQVWRELGVLGNRVFTNAAPYLRVRASAKGTANLEMDPLDDTRIHPESYEFAIQMARSAVPSGEGEDDPVVAVENAFARPQEVETLDLIFYDQHLQKEQGGGGAEGGPRGSKLATLIDIQLEFVAPYGELRGEMQPPKPEDVFFLCTGETPDTLKLGRKVSARVRFVGENEARCLLPDIGNLEAVLERHEVSATRGPDINLRDFLQPHTTFDARIIQLDPAEWVVKLSSRSDVLGDELKWEHMYLAYNKDTGDKDYVIPSVDELKAAAQEQRRRTQVKIVHRPIQHPLFRNITLSDAAAELTPDSVPVGRCIIRPSATRGPNALNISMKLPLSVWHIEVEEKGKTPNSIKLGSQLIIQWYPGKKETYEDLDEVTARYIEPVQGHLEKLVGHRKWKSEPWERAKEELSKEKETSQGRAVYCLCADGARAGIFILGFVLTTSPRREFFTITPDGYYFRRKNYPSVDHMLMAFKRQPRLPQQQDAPPPPPPQQPVTGVPHAMAAGRGMGAPPPGAFYAEQQGGYGGYGQEVPPPPPQQPAYGDGPGYGAPAAGPGFGGPGGGAAGGPRPWQGGPGMGGPPVGGPGMGMVPQQQAVLAAQQMAANFAAQHQAQQQQQQQQGWQQQSRPPPGPAYGRR
ncbi:hypothetical protein ABPG77_005082 [Micractinium sp. CCAP 211/92]